MFGLVHEVPVTFVR